MLLDRIEILGKTLKVPRHTFEQGGRVHVFDLLHRVRHQFPVAGAHRGDRKTTVAAHHGGYTVEAGRCQRWVPEDLRVVVGVDVDETRCNHTASCVEHPVTNKVVADLDDLAACNQYVRADAGRSRAVDHRATPDDGG